MIRQCAWCCCTLGEVAPLDDYSVTHSVCPECYVKFLEPSGDDLGGSRNSADDLPAAGILSIEGIS